MEELKRFQGSTFDTISRRRLIEDRDTILELTGKESVSRNELRPFLVLANLGRKDWNNWNDVPVHVGQDRESSPEIGTPTITTN